MPAKEKIALAEELWSSVENELLPVTDEEILFVKERLQLHEGKPNEGVTMEMFRKYFEEKHGF